MVQGSELRNSARCEHLQELFLIRESTASHDKD
eukprot:gene26565-biopygen16874